MSKLVSEMTPAERTVDRLKTVAVIGGMLICAYLFIDGFYNRHVKLTDIAAHPRYTIGQVSRTSYAIGPSPQNIVFFEYRVGDSIYGGNNSGQLLSEGDRFLVKFSSAKPSYHESYNRVRIPSSIINAPPEGWAEPPFEVPAELLK